ncbi:MAG: ribosome-associated translation inhibitor RaiA [Ruminococcaceae bacterium]|nr:ribosome-associated translation inhibitor RaiA [Oscillospiraceae bacterium]
MNFTARQMRVYDSVKEMAEKKLSKFDKFFTDGAEMDITFSMPNELEKVEVTIRSQGFVFRAEEASESFATSVDRVIDALERQIRKNKTRLQKKIRAEGFELLDIELPEIEEEEYDSIKVKTFPFKPMGVEEAILQMNLVGHDFYVFKDAASLETCVVYKRKAGGYGLIVPEN